MEGSLSQEGSRYLCLFRRHIHEVKSKDTGKSLAPFYANTAQILGPVFPGKTDTSV